MRVVIQRAKEARVEVNHKIIGKIDHGFVLLVGFNPDDTKEVVDKLVNKIVGLRIFSDEDEKMNLSLKDVNGEILSISQFTLYANCKKGKRPSFIEAARPEIAIPLYNYFNERIASEGISIETGEFGADMKVYLMNDGPVTIILDSNEL